VIFPDHHDYPPASLERIESTVQAENAAGILTTAKDGVKLRGRLDVALAELPIRAEPEPSFWIWLDQEITRIVSK
jgi:tetraacyldisaccharide-1-P 4'-kinase